MVRIPSTSERTDEQAKVLSTAIQRGFLVERYPTVNLVADYVYACGLAGCRAVLLFFEEHGTWALTVAEPEHTSVAAVAQQLVNEGALIDRVWPDAGVVRAFISEARAVDAARAIAVKRALDESSGLS
jgi:hypothetical protein